MRIVRRAEFLKLPPGTLYVAGKRWIFRGPELKHETTGNDWYFQKFDWIEAHDSNEAIDRLEEMLESGVSYPLETSIGRDGSFSEDELFLIFEAADIAQMQSDLAWAASVADGLA
jgi:hypothetical protein